MADGVHRYIDDAFGSGETVRFNGGPDNGPLDGNGNNTLTITSGNDTFGWLVSAAVTPVPEPGTLVLLAGGGLMALLGAGRVRRREPTS